MGLRSSRICRVGLPINNVRVRVEAGSFRGACCPWKAQQPGGVLVGLPTSLSRRSFFLVLLKMCRSRTRATNGTLTMCSGPIAVRAAVIILETKRMGRNSCPPLSSFAAVSRYSPLGFLLPEPHDRRHLRRVKVGNANRNRRQPVQKNLPFFWP